MLLESFLFAGVALATPILLAALGELLVERVGIINIGLEGFMLCGAFAAALAASSADSPALGALAGAVAGSIMAGAFAAAVVGWAADQIIVGAAVNLLALGATGALYRELFGQTGAALVLPALDPFAIPLLADLPVLGPVLFAQNPLVYFAWIGTGVVAFVLFRTGLGLRLRALGDHPLAAASLGISVRQHRAAVVLIAGALAGLAGAALVLATARTFVEGITAGRGFIALAVVVFARWTPVGALAGSLLFGLASALQFQFQAADLGVPYQLFLMLPYLVTLAVLALSRGATRAPLALGTPYDPA
jgi:general nucleoside transport system permease protein